MEFIDAVNPRIALATQLGVQRIGGQRGLTKSKNRTNSTKEAPKELEGTLRAQILKNFKIA